MKEAICQFDGRAMVPVSPEDLEALGQEFKRNQLTTGRFTKIGKGMEPSIIQGNLLHACFSLVTDSSSNPQHRTKKATKMACKIGIDFRDPSLVFVRPDGMVQFSYRSFSHKALQGIEREEVIQKAFNWCAEALGITVDELIAEAKKRMQQRPGIGTSW